MSSVKGFLYEKYTELMNKVNDPLSTSEFLERGVLTPEEFMIAGDLLTLKCPSWSWQESCSKTLQKGLPKEKQFLLTKNVPSLMRLSAFEASLEKATTMVVEEDGEGGWLATHTNEKKTEEADIPEISTEDDIPEIDLEDKSLDNGELKEKTSSNVVKTRTYDISITYDQYHQTPRMWLFGYDENGKPLKPEEVLQDISQDHANKTVTTAVHPHTGVVQAYIHPCKHASVMQKLVQRMKTSGKTPRVDQYLFIFLKFMHAVIPTIEYDYTLESACEKTKKMKTWALLFFFLSMK
jgi:ubiquitin-like-conjugating enzyme ATG3